MELHIQFDSNIFKSWKWVSNFSIFSYLQSEHHYLRVPVKEKRLIFICNYFFQLSFFLFLQLYGFRPIIYGLVDLQLRFFIFWMAYPGYLRFIVNFLDISLNFSWKVSCYYLSCFLFHAKVLVVRDLELVWQILDNTENLAIREE